MAAGIAYGVSGIAGGRAKDIVSLSKVELS